MKKTMIMILAAALLVVATASASYAGRTHEQILEDARIEMERVCGSLIPYMEKPENVTMLEVIDEDVINAYADNEGRVAVYMGMMNFFQSEDELAAVCGHELAHLSREHIKKSVNTSILATVASAVVGGTAGDIVGSLIYTKDSRSHEREADRNGLLYAWARRVRPLRQRGPVGRHVTPQQHHGPGKIPVNAPGSRGTHRELPRPALSHVCKEGQVTRYCEEIMADPELQHYYNQFESR